MFKLVVTKNYLTLLELFYHNTILAHFIMGLFSADECNIPDLS